MPPSRRRPRTAGRASAAWMTSCPTRATYLYERTRVDRSAADLLVAVDGKRIRTVDELLTVVESYKPGTRVNVTVIRGGEEVSVPVTLDESR